MNIAYQVVRSPSRKRSAVLKVLADGMVQVRAPMSMREAEIIKFVEANRSWIENQLSKQNIIRPKKIETGELWPYLGEIYMMKIISTRLRPRLEVDQGLFLLRVNARITQTLRRNLIVNWYKKQARELIVMLVKKYAAAIGKSFGTIKLKDTSSRWGSCSSEGNLNFNWRLILAPKAVLDYVVIHEVCHLVHQHHRPSFWRLVESLDPEYRKSRTYLKHHGWKLQV